jgi:phage terminase large subunit-like protein
VTAEGLAEQRQAVPDSAFRRFHANQWIHSAIEPWVGPDAWAACRSDRRLGDGERVVLAFDGSYNGDSTVIVACSLEPDGIPPHIELVGIWKPADTGVTVPVDAVEARIAELCGRFRVEEIVADPWLWQRSLQALAERFPVVEWPQSPSRMAPACAAFYQAVMSGQVTHHGDPDLSAHIGNAARKPNGAISKPSKGSPRRIDAAVASVMALAASRSQPTMVPMVAFR